MKREVKYSDPKVAEQLRRKNFERVEPYANGMFQALMAMRGRDPGVIVFDTTGRDGMQTNKAFVNANKYTTDSKIEVVKAIVDWGIPSIEVGYPGASTAELEAARCIVRMAHGAGLETNLIGLAGTVNEHIRAAIEAGLDEVHIFSSGSLPHAWTKRNKSPEDCADDVVAAVKYAVSVGFKKILVSLEDAFSADPAFIAEVANRVADAAGGNAQIRYNIPDTIAVADPLIAYAFTACIREKSGVPIDVHFHNDGGLAAANSVFAVAAGATRVHTTVNGLGERAGNTSISEFLVHLYQHYGIIPRDVSGRQLDVSRLMAVSEHVAGLSGIPIPANEVAIGKDAFAHVSGVHADGYLKSMRQDAAHSVYVPFDPRIFGNREKVVRSPLAGKSNHVVTFMEFGIDVEHPAVAGKIKAISDEDKKLCGNTYVSDAEFILNAYRAIEGQKCEALKIADIKVGVGRSVKTYAEGEAHVIDEGGWATVVVELDGERITAGGIGNGPVDAAVNAIKSAIGEKESLKIVNYDNHSIGKGSDASAQVEMDVQNGGASMETSFIGPNTTLIAVDAYVQAYNAIRALERLRHNYPAKQGAA